jgi:hypothetical protein
METEQLQASGGCVKPTIDRYMITLKEEASIEEFCLFEAYSGGITIFNEKLDLDVLFEYLMEFQIRCIDVNEAIKL